MEYGKISLKSSSFSWFYKVFQEGQLIEVDFLLTKKKGKDSTLD